jgi:hypothetical protein
VVASVTVESWRVDSKGSGDGWEGFAGAVATVGVVGVGLGHLGLVDAPRYATGFKVSRDGSSMNPELCGEVGERPARSIGGDEMVDLGLVEAALNGASNRFWEGLPVTDIGRVSNPAAAPGCRAWKPSPFSSGGASETRSER